MNYIYVIIALIKFLTIKLFRTHNFSFTFANLVYPYCDFEFSRNSLVQFGYKVSFRRNTQIVVRNKSVLCIGNDCFFNFNCVIICHQNISIGDNCKFGPGCMMFDHDHDIENSKTIVQNKFKEEAITIGNGCWFGAGCIILKGTSVGSHCVFGAGSIIKGKYEDYSIVIQKRKSIISKFNE